MTLEFYPSEDVEIGKRVTIVFAHYSQRRAVSFDSARRVFTIRAVLNWGYHALARFGLRCVTNLGNFSFTAQR